MRIAIGDSNELEVFGLQSLCDSLEACDKVTVFQRCSDLLADKAAPHLVILDFTADGFGLESIARVKQRYPSTPILAITPIQSANTVMSAMKAGITGYVKKDCSIEEIKESIYFTAKSQSFYCGDILRLMDAESIDFLNLDLETLDCAPLLLTDREAEILRYIAVGQTNVEIAEMLFLSSHTINTHRKNILAKIGAKNTAGAVIYAVKEGLIDPERFEFTR